MVRKKKAKAAPGPPAKPRSSANGRSAGGLHPFGARIGRYLKECRQAQGLSQRALAERSDAFDQGFDDSWVSQWERDGPKAGFVKSLGYLHGTGADLKLVSELVLLKDERPKNIDPSETRTALAEIQRLTGEGQVTKALPLALAVEESAAQRDDLRNWAQALISLSVTAKVGERFAIARRAAQAALGVPQIAELDPTVFASAAIQLSTLEVRRGRLDAAGSALVRLDEALRVDPSIEASWWHARGFLAFARGRDSEVVEAYSRALEQYPKDSYDSWAPVRVRACLAFAYSRLGQPGAARRQLERVLGELPPVTAPESRWRALTHAGRALTHLGSHNKARSVLEQALGFAREVQQETREFQSRLYLLELAAFSRDRALGSLNRRKLRGGRQALDLPWHLALEYEQIVAAYEHHVGR